MGDSYIPMDSLEVMDMEIKTYDAILNSLPTGFICRGDTSGVILMGALWHALWLLTILIGQEADKAYERWESQDYYNEVLSEIYWHSMGPGYPDDEQIMQADIDTLKEALDDLSPIGYYFGGHPDDPWRLGVWPEWRNAE